MTVVDEDLNGGVLKVVPDNTVIKVITSFWGVDYTVGHVSELPAWDGVVVNLCSNT